MGTTDSQPSTPQTVSESPSTVFSSSTSGFPLINLSKSSSNPTAQTKQKRKEDASNTKQKKMSGKTSMEWRTQTKKSFALQVKVDEDIIRQGMLKKQGKHKKTMRKYYCVLLATGTLVFRHPKTFEELRRAKLYNCVSVKLTPSNQPSTTKGNSGYTKFQVITTKRTWEFEAETENDANQWILAISVGGLFFFLSYTFVIRS
ncbi:hypothetical protein RFI_04609 [Reticulomyxa filosa]|uniref:PH domain-containing protein n=1 Tax=Reticulomyxa filosa TaxID=46433 RepID=X6P1T9_RETFI|nr:hypothetical protein RFI_04609 [Reticulomyxa filosa]|eukprot:ETO32505.1 hypothetical protein RFI_04609 [Reticulomyxa filosa]